VVHWLPRNSVSLSIPPTTHRQIVEEASFTEAVKAFGISFTRLDEALWAVTEAVATHPEKQPTIPGTVLSMVKTRTFPGVPALRIFFTYTEVEVHLLKVERIDDESPDNHSQ
jgi:hypothetical protein